VSFRSVAVTLRSIQNVCLVVGFAGEGVDVFFCGLGSCEGLRVGEDGFCEPVLRSSSRWLIMITEGREGWVWSCLAAELIKVKAFFL
jgi:hypothetical protein